MRNTPCVWLAAAVFAAIVPSAFSDDVSQQLNTVKKGMGKINRPSAGRARAIQIVL